MTELASGGSAAGRTYRLRVLKAAWGIAIDLRGRATVVSDLDPDAVTVSQRVMVKLVDLRLAPDDVAHLLAGLARVSGPIEATRAEGRILIEIDRLDYTPTDYQTEGVEAAAIGWAEEEFGLSLPTPVIAFDPVVRRYVFAF